MNKRPQPRCQAGDPGRLQRLVVHNLLRDLLPGRGVPPAEITISADGTRVRLRGPYEAIWYATRIAGQARAQIEAGTVDLEVAVPIGGTEVIVHYLVTD